MSLKQPLKPSIKLDNKDPSFSINDQPLLQRIHWFRLIYLSSMPLIAIYGAFTTKIVLKTAIFHVLYLILNSISITAGYHRYWAHRSFKASKALQIFMTFSACATVQGSIFWWCRDHRIHHRYTDTPKDPYNAKAGFFYSHIGWLFTKRDRRRLGYVDTSDLQADKLVMFQNNYYLPLAIFFGYIVPICVCGLGWGDWRGGYYYACIWRMVYIHHSTFAVNSVAHYIGNLTYGDSTTAKDSVITALLTFGEGYHNFHHEFANDYRNGIRFYHYDPTKWFIWFCSLAGLASDLKTFPENEIKKGYVEMKLREISKIQTTIDYGTPLEKLPLFTMDEFIAQVNKSNKQWIIIQDVIYDVSSFTNEHPGGIPLLQNSVGKDVTEAFNGGVYNHQKAARNLLAHLRVGSITA
ncbi:hypothetical protein BB561_005724 [Smittium simulii]|uniref:Acyl-CoA desaturase n=1 Tax=Smittium simulii TaxID=133385 RepID=A0A2T9Y8V1_9FUNG|nr:hypothetical protein BB561_005724 [Smittium simulii]